MATNSASGKDNPFDNQSNGQAFLTMGGPPTAFTPNIVASISGSASCNRSDVTLATDYPNAYPLQGKMIFKYQQSDAALKQIQNQIYVRLGTDPLDVDITHITLRGIAIKGPGVGGDVERDVRVRCGVRAHQEPEPPRLHRDHRGRQRLARGAAHQPGGRR